jgi:hypothetical protein
MFRIVAGWNLSRVLATSIASPFLSASACAAAAGPQSHADTVIGAIDDIRYASDQYYVFGGLASKETETPATFISTRATRRVGRRREVCFGRQRRLGQRAGRWLAAQRG